MYHHKVDNSPYWYMQLAENLLKMSVEISAYNSPWILTNQVWVALNSVPLHNLLGKCLCYYSSTSTKALWVEFVDRNWNNTIVVYVFLFWCCGGCKQDHLHTGDIVHFQYSTKNISDHGERGKGWWQFRHPFVENLAWQILFWLVWVW